MAEEPSATESHIHDTGQTKKAAASGGNIITHKLGPLPVWGWFAIALGTYLLYRHFKGGSSTQTSPSGTITTGNNATIGGDGTSTGTTSAPVSTTPGLDWINSAFQALQSLGYDNGTISGALQAYSTGQTLNPTQYGIIEAAIRLIGNPPSALGNPTQTPNGGPTKTGSPIVGSPISGRPPGLPAALISAMQGNGEHIVSTVFDPTYNTWVYLTQKGGIYTLDSSGNPTSSGFFGSAFSLPPGTFQGTAQQLIVNPDGGYTIVNTAGQTYNYDKQGTGADYANNPSGS